MIHKQAGPGQEPLGGQSAADGAEDVRIATSITSTTSIPETLKTKESEGGADTHSGDVARPMVNKGHQTR